MKYIKTFEFYLSGGKQPLYHNTGIYRLEQILNDDELKIQSRFVDNIPDCICVTRNANYEERKSDVRIVLDTDKLLRDGYRAIPIDEITQNYQFAELKAKQYSKSNPKFVLSGLRYTPNKIGKNPYIDDIKSDVFMEFEYEERIFKNIKNLHKYVLYIDLNDNQVPQSVKQYIEKYSNILVRDKSKNPYLPELIKAN